MVAEPRVPRGRLTLDERRRNIESRDAWERFGPHRERVTNLLLAARPASAPRASLAMLGAGNLNDVDLRRLVDAFEAVHLFDLDGDAMGQGVVRQLGELQAGSRIHMHGDLDVTGIWPSLEGVAAGAGSAADSLVRAALDADVELPGAPFDVVVSLGTLSQLLDAVQRATGATTGALELIQAVRHRHLRLLLEATAPGGVALLVFEFVSSTTCPELSHATLDELPSLVARLIARRNFFTGLNPAALGRLVATDDRLKSLVGVHEFELPWLWDLGPRVYACTALRMQAP